MATIKSFKELRSAGGIVSKKPVKRHIEWTTTDPESDEEVSYDADIYIIKLASGVMVDVYAEKTKEQIAMIISKTVMLANDAGKPELMDYADAYQLDTPLRNALWDEVKKVAGLERKNSQPNTSSSATSSSTESAEEQSQSAESV